MMETLRFVVWRMRQHPGWSAWALFLLYATVGFRLVVVKETSWVGIADDLALVCLLGAGASAMAGLPGPSRLAVLGLLGLVLATYNLCNALFYGFFDSLLNADSWRLLYQLDGARQSVKAVLSTRTVALHVAIPLLLLTLALWRSRHWRPRVGTPLRHALVPLAVVLMAAQAAVSASLPIASENNGILILGRQLAQRWWQGRAGGTQFTQDMMATYDQTYLPPRPDQYVTRTDPDFPLLKVPVEATTRPTKPLNVVIILMESVRLWELGIDSEKPLAPTLNRLAHESIYYTRFYANAHQTVRDEFVVMCGGQSYFGGGQEYSMFPDLGINCLASIFQSHGYQTHWISSYHADYADKRGFHRRHGVEVFSDFDGITKRKLKAPHVGWGPSDEDLADYAVDVLDQARGPFFAEIMTLSSHHPFNGPFDVERLERIEHSTESRMYKDYVAALQYVDKALTRFFEKARKRPWFDDTMFVILGDHGVWFFPESGARSLTPTEKVEVYHRTPLIIHAPKHFKPERRDVIGSQVDLAPTLLDILGMTAPNAFEGVSLLRTDVTHAQRRILVGTESGWSIRQGDKYCYLTGIECFEYFQPMCPPGYVRKRRAHACFTTDKDLLNIGKEPLPVTMLGERDSSELLALGKRLVDNHNHLLLHDALYPRKGPGTGKNSQYRDGPPEPVRGNTE